MNFLLHHGGNEEHCKEIEGQNVTYQSLNADANCLSPRARQIFESRK